MTPNSLKRWLDRNRPRAAYLRLVVERIGAELLVVTQWVAGAQTEQELVGLVLDACNDYAEENGEPVKFLIQWCDHNDKPIATAHHRAAPGDLNPDDPKTDLSINSIVAQFMRHDEAREKVLLGALGSIFGAHEKTIQLQQNMISTLIEQQKRDHLEMQAMRVQREQHSEREPTDEERQEAVARANALNKLGELAPMVLAHLVQRGGGTVQ